MRILVTIVVYLVVGCTTVFAQQYQSLFEARKGFETKIIRIGNRFGAAELPPGTTFKFIRYNAPAGKLGAYVTIDPGDGKKHPAIVWITGGDSNSIGDVWTPQDKSNDQSASAFRKAGIVMMFPSQRGGNNNPGKREGFYGEVEDILAATDYLENLPYVDPNQIYLGGHSTGGTLAMLVGEYTPRFRAVFSFGPVASPWTYGEDFIFCDPNDKKEMILRSPIFWLHSVKSPMYVFEGANSSNWDSIQLMVDLNPNPAVKFFNLPGHDHFSLITPVTELLAKQIRQGQINVTRETIQSLR